MQTAGHELEAIPREWLEEFEAAARRPLKTRFRYAFIHTYKNAKLARGRLESPERGIMA
jgi:hypothetical protein